MTNREGHESLAGRRILKVMRTKAVEAGAADEVTVARWAVVVRFTPVPVAVARTASAAERYSRMHVATAAPVAEA